MAEAAFRFHVSYPSFTDSGGVNGTDSSRILMWDLGEMGFTTREVLSERPTVVEEGVGRR
jgi:hypothetical protein